MSRHQGNPARTVAIRSGLADAASWGWVIANATVFTSSACIMVIELVAGRIISRHLGSSVYTWTSVIGIVLAGIAVGNYLGGLIADRYSSKKTLAKMFMCAAAAAGAITVLDHIAEDWSLLWMLSWPTRVASHVAVAFFLPTAVLGMISPIVAKMALDLGRDKGRTIGDIYAWGVTGSIIGTFLAGFYLIAALGTQGVVWSVAGVLAIMAILYWPKTANTWAVAVGVALLAWTATGSSERARSWGEALSLRPRHSELVLYSKESQYSHVAIVQIGTQPDTRGMMLDTLLHSQINMENPTDFHYDYEKVYSAITRRLRPTQPHVDSLTIGGGGYVYPRYMTHTWPGSRTDVAEIDPVVTEASFVAFGLPRDTPINCYHQDGRVLVDQLVEQKRAGEITAPYDLIYCDAVHDYNVPFQLATKEFMTRARELIRPEGAYLMNMIDIFENGLFLGALVNTMKTVFPHVYVFVEGVPVAASRGGRNTFIIAGMNQPFDATALGAVYDPNCRIFRLTDEEMNELENKSQALVLTDEYAPVENLLAPVVKEATRSKAMGEWLKRSDLAIEDKDYPRAIRLCERGLELLPNSAELLAAWGRALHLNGDDYEAVAKFRKALDVRPTYDEALQGLVQTHLSLNEDAQALPYYEALLRSNPFNTSLRYNYAVSLMQLDKLPEAIEQFRIIARIKPDFANNYNNWGVALYKSGDLPGAIAQYNRALEADPSNLDARMNLAVALSGNGQYTEAIETWRGCLSQKPDDPNAARIHVEIANAYYSLRKAPEALEEYQRAAQIKPDYGDAHFGRANALAALGRLDEAKAAYRTVLKLNPGDQEAGRRLENIEKIQQEAASQNAPNR